MSDSYRRPDDHLVEPLFEGLEGAQRDAAADRSVESEESPRDLLTLRRLAAAMVAIAGGAVAWLLW